MPSVWVFPVRMKLSVHVLVGLAMVVGVFIVPPVTGEVVIDFVSIGHANNAAAGDGYGAVGHAYKIGKHEVTNSQYAEFLNAADADGKNPNGIYNESMGKDPRGGITFASKAARAAKYSLRDGMGDKPVTFVSWYDAARFVNWLHNGQGGGSTEKGAYVLKENSGIVIKDAQAKVWIPSEDEWYKAAYFNPADASYSVYPMQGSTAPTPATADAAGGISNPGPNVANFSSGADWKKLDGNVTTVGSAGASSASFYGTCDQGGNVSEWNDAVIKGSLRGQRGGAWFSMANSLKASSRIYFKPTFESNYTGFRVACGS